jgi:hypothetical protein
VCTQEVSHYLLREPIKVHWFSISTYQKHKRIIIEDNVSFSNDMNDKYDKLFKGSNPLHVVINNEACKKTTITRIENINKHEMLLEVVQVFTALNLIITKAYISSNYG